MSEHKSEVRGFVLFSAVSLHLAQCLIPSRCSIIVEGKLKQYQVCTEHMPGMANAGMTKWRLSQPSDRRNRKVTGTMQ